MLNYLLRGALGDRSRRAHLPGGSRSSRQTRVAAFRTVLLAAIVFAGQFVLAPMSRATTANSTFTPVADSYVNQASAGTNYGTQTQLRTDASPSVVRSYLRFNVASLSGTIAKATLKVYANTSNAGGIGAAAVADTSWNETSITWSNAPAVGAAAGSVSSISANAWVSLDVTSLVKGTGLVSMAVTSPSATAESLASRESSNAPQLIVTTNIPDSTTTTLPAPSADVQPSFPIRGAFYYPWFPEGWNQQGMNPFTKYHPSLGYYDSSNTSVIANHIGAMQYGGMNMAISSWWGQGTPTDARVPALLNGAANTNFRFSLYYEQEGTSDPSVAQLTSDLTYMRDHYGSNTSYLRVNGRFVVFVYAGGNDVCGMADRWKQANTVGAYVVLKVFPGYTGCA